MAVIRASGGRALAVGVAVVFSTAALADWRYCYASAPDQHRFYMSLPFVQTQPAETIEDAFRRMLDERGIQPRAVVCPRGHDQAEVQERMDHATSYNRQNGNTVVPLDWSPASLTASPVPRRGW
jgi:hypothetical protein